METVLPKNINYMDNLPRAIPSEPKRRNFFPANGNNYTLNGGQTAIIEIADVRGFLDTTDSFLRFQLNNNSAGVGIATDFSPDFGGGHCFIRNLRVQQAGNTIMNIQRYNRLYNAIIAPVQGKYGFKQTKSLTGGIGMGGSTNAANVNAPATAAEFTGAVVTGSRCNSVGAAGVPALVGTDDTCEFVVPLFGGLFSQNKLIPLPMLNSPIQIILDLETIVNCGAFTVAPRPQDFTITNMRYCAQMVEIPRDVMGYLKSVQEQHGGSLILPATSYEHSAGVISDLAGNGANSGLVGEVSLDIPTRKSSISSVQFVMMASPDTIGVYAADGMSGLGAIGTHTVMNLSSAGDPCLVNYQLRAGAHVIPNVAIVAPGGRSAVNAGAAGANGTAPIAGRPNKEDNRGESMLELQKAYGQLNTLQGSGSCNVLTWDNDALDIGTEFVCAQGQLGAGNDLCTARGDNAPSVESLWRFCPFAIDCEAFQRQALHSGLDTKSLSLQMQLVLNIDNTRSTRGAGGANAPTNVGTTNDVNVDIYTMYDVMYYINSDGSITYSD